MKRGLDFKPVDRIPNRNEPSIYSATLREFMVSGAPFVVLAERDGILASTIANHLRKARDRLGLKFDVDISVREGRVYLRRCRP